MESSVNIQWHSANRKAKCAPDPSYPNGKPLDVTLGSTGCLIDLPYPAEECGAWIVHCKACDTSVAIPTAVEKNFSMENNNQEEINHATN